jgi:HK97 gp10 family phage protein
MAYKGKDFSIDTKNLEVVLSQIKGQQKKIDKELLKKMNAAVNVVYATARAKRPMITKAEMKATGRTTRVSDPNAEVGVPVRTGALQISIQKSVESKLNSIVGKVFTQSPYGSYVEFGTSKMAARPFMRPALNVQMEAIKAIFASKR